MAVTRKDKMLAGYYGNLESVIVHDKKISGKPVEITNGLFVVVQGLAEGQRETKNAYLATKADVAEDVVFIHNSEVMYDERKYKLSDFVIEAGKVARGYRLFDGDIMTLTTDLYADTVKVDDVLAVKANGKIGKLTEAEMATAKVTFTVIEDSGFDLDPTMGAFAVQVTRK